MLHHGGIFGRKKLDFEGVFWRMAADAAGDLDRGLGRGLEVVQLSDGRYGAYFSSRETAG
jgi:hypothetical protein